METVAQQEIWQSRTRNVRAEDVLEMRRRPYPFQVEFSGWLNEAGRAVGQKKPLRVCELGCEFGITSLLLSPEIFERHALDLNAHALATLETVAARLGENLQLHCGDMFATSFADGEFDVVFNNGVLEHYSTMERRRALQECARIVRADGKVIVGVPNHYSLPYRIAYLLRNWTGRWPYPPEEKIKDFSRELQELPSLRMNQIILFDHESIYGLLPRAKLTAVPFRLMDRFKKFQGYLRVIELKKVRDR